MTKSIATFALLFSTSASAGIYTGSPVGFQIDRPQQDFFEALAQVDKVRIHNCDATFKDYAVDEMVDLVEGFSVDIDGGDLCSAELFWSSDLVVTGPGYTVQAFATSTSVSLDPITDAAVTPYKVTMGSMPSPASGPRLSATLP